MAWRLPNRLEYPGPDGGFVVAIKIVPRESIHGGAHGDYDPDTDTIQIARDLSPAERRAVYLHEKKHADADYELWLAQKVPVKVPQSQDLEEEEEVDAGG